MSGKLTASIGEVIREWAAAWPKPPKMIDLDRALRQLAKWRSLALAATYVAHHGTTVRNGLFKGMDYTSEASEGSLMARLLGTYEAELQPHIQSFAAEGVDCVIDVGCAEGYYAVGLARSFHHLKVYAYDTDDRARTACAELALRNGVGDRVVIGSEFRPVDFDDFADRRVLVMVDIEGAELELLQPRLSPALAGMNIIVETHDVWKPGTLAELIARFEPTHHVVRVDQTTKAVVLPEWLANLSELDQMLATWEWRHRLTPWLVMRPRVEDL
jgi:hypothetical protein